MYIHKVANDFVREYYTRLYNSPSTLYELYAADATLIHGNEGDKKQSELIRGKENVKSHLTREKFAKSKVVITDVSSVSSSASLVSVLVMGDMKYGESPSKMFVQSFSLQYTSERGYLVITDILKFPQQEAVVSGNKVETTIKAPSKSGKTSDISGSRSRKGSTDKKSPEPANPPKPTVSSQSSEVSASVTADSTPEIGETSEEAAEKDTEKMEKAKKFKFSFDTIANAPSFRPKNSVPSYPVNYAMNGYSPSYSPAPAYQAMQAPMIQYQVPPPFQQGGFVPHMQAPQPPFREHAPQDKYRNNHQN